MLSFYRFISKNCGECKMSFVNNGFNTFKMNDSTCANVDNSRDVKKIINMFKYKFEALSYYVCFNITYSLHLIACIFAGSCSELAIFCLNSANYYDDS